MRGFFDSEGCVDKSKKVVAVSVNKRGINNITTLLSSMGIRSNILKNFRTKGNRRHIYTLNITGRNYIELYNQKIGFSIKRKQKKLDKLLKNYKLKITPHQDVIKLQNNMLYLRNKGLSYQKIANELNISMTTIWNYINRYN